MAFLMISSVATMGWGKLRPRRALRLEVIALFGLVGAALITEPWWTLIGICAVYLAMLPVGMIAYAKVKRQRVPQSDPAG
jgi:CDP-diacylglycerol--serine O-phosphatidyltransferase